MTIVGLSDAPLPWPIGRVHDEDQLIVYKGLATALRSETAEAVAQTCRIPLETVLQWQKLLADKGDARQVRRETTQCLTDIFPQSVPLSS